MNDVIKRVCELSNLHLLKSETVSGGDINNAYAVDTTIGSFFLKLNSASSFLLMFQREAEGLEALRQSSMLLIPSVVAVGQADDQQYLLLEWIDKAKPSADFWTTFATGLAELHKITNPHFGWQSSNYIGSLVQQNDFKTSWSEFYTTQRIQPLVQQLYDDGSFAKSDAQNADRLCKMLNEIFPEEPPALLHGDLWNGNFMVANAQLPAETEQTLPAIFDPAVYFGHREMDLGMTLLFGGFDSKFYDAYHAHFPLEKNWRQRVSLTQLYPLLVHAVLFGGNYVSRCKAILKKWS